LIQSPKVLWGEGLFLRPQHFQQQDAYHEWRLAQMARLLHPYAWGVRHVKVDPDALQTGLLRLLELQVVFPDGELFNAPADDELPPPVALSSLAESADQLSGEWTFHVALAPLRAHGTNMAATREEADTAVRYYRKAQQAADAYTDAVSAEVVVLRKSAKVLPDASPKAHLVSLPLLRLKKTSTGGFEQDGRFIPPCANIQASPALFLHLRRLLDVLQAKVDALYGLHREPSKNIIEFRSGDVASFWLLHTASAAFAGLSHLALQDLHTGRPAGLRSPQRGPGLHPPGPDRSRAAGDGDLDALFLDRAARTRAVLPPGSAGCRADHAQDPALPGGVSRHVAR
jgi:type VI secretion system protein ImpJ